LRRGREMAEEEEKGQSAQIRERLLGLTEEEDIRSASKELAGAGFNAGTIRNVISDMRKRSELPPKNGDKATTALEVVYPSKVGKGEFIPPELALRGIQLEDGNYRKGFTDGMAVLILAARYNQMLAAGQAEILSNQLKIMEESRKGSAEAAREAAGVAAASVGAQLMPEIQALKSHMVAQAPNPMASLMMTLMEPAFRQAAQQIAGLFVKTQPVTPQAEQPGQPSQQQPAQPWTPPNVEIHRREELQE
jgi:hypothetical protein